MEESEAIDRISRFMSEAVWFALFATVLYIVLRLFYVCFYKKRSHSSNIEPMIEDAIKRQTGITPEDTFRIENINHE